MLQDKKIDRPTFIDKTYRVCQEESLMGSERFHSLIG